MALPFFGVGMKTGFSSPVATAEFSTFVGILSASLSQHHLSGFEIAGIPSPPLALFVVKLLIAKFRLKLKKVGKNKGEKERYTHLNAEFRRIARRAKKAFLSDQCKKIEENNRMGKTRDLLSSPFYYFHVFLYIVY